LTRGPACSCVQPGAVPLDLSVDSKPPLMTVALGAEVAVLVVVIGTTVVATKVVRTVCRVVESSVLTGVSAAIVAVVEILPVAIDAQAAEMREGDQDDTEAGVCMARFLLLTVKTVLATMLD
jgi:hypothetical protein